MLDFRVQGLCAIQEKFYWCPAAPTILLRSHAYTRSYGEPALHPLSLISPAAVSLNPHLR